MKIKDILESATAGATSSGNIAAMPIVGGGSNVGTLFGGSYNQKSPAKRKPKTRKDSLIRR